MSFANVIIYFVARCTDWYALFSEYPVPDLAWRRLATKVRHSVVDKLTTAVCFYLPPLCFFSQWNQFEHELGLGRDIFYELLAGPFHGSRCDVLHVRFGACTFYFFHPKWSCLSCRLCRPCRLSRPCERVDFCSGVRNCITNWQQPPRKPRHRSPPRRVSSWKCCDVSSERYQNLWGGNTKIRYECYYLSFPCSTIP